MYSLSILQIIWMIIVKDIWEIEWTSICTRCCKGNDVRHKLKNTNTTKEYSDKEYKYIECSNQCPIHWNHLVDISINIMIIHNDQEISHIQTTPSTTTFCHIQILKNALECDWNLPYCLFHYVDKSSILLFSLWILFIHFCKVLVC